jgi:hypothetical protein
MWRNSGKKIDIIEDMQYYLTSAGGEDNYIKSIFDSSDI